VPPHPPLQAAAVVAALAVSNESAARHVGHGRAVVVAVAQYLRDVLHSEALERLDTLEFPSRLAEDDASRLEQAEA